MEFEASHVGKRAAVWAYAWHPHCLHCSRSGRKVNHLYHKSVCSEPVTRKQNRSYASCSLKLSVACWLSRATIPAVCPGCTPAHEPSRALLCSPLSPVVAHYRLPETGRLCFGRDQNEVCLTVRCVVRLAVFNGRAARI